MTSIKVLMATAALLIGASPLAIAQQTTGNPGSSAAASQPSTVNGQENGTGPNAKVYGTKKHMGREQPEQKQDMGSGAGK
jgi:hypothetical protein